MNLRALASVAVIALAIFLWLRRPSSRGIAKEMQLDVKAGRIDYKGITYEASWSDETHRFEGDLRYVGRAYSGDLPLVTHDAILTTGDFSDPKLVKVSPLKNGSGSWRAKSRPDGTLVALHFIPSNLAIHRQLAGLREGDTVEIEGMVETDSRVDASNGGYWRLNHSNHKLVLVTAVKKR